MSPFVAIVEASQEIGWPQSYRQDLYVHDRNALLAADAPATFAWGLGPCGTHLVRPDATDETKRAYVEHFRDTLCLIYWWDGVSLTRVSVDTAACLLAV